MSVKSSRFLPVLNQIGFVPKLPDLPEGVRNFLFIGRFERRKGVQELNVILAELIHSERFHFHFIGPIPPSKRIKSDKITYHGQKSNKEELQEIMDQCQVLVTPSHSEGMPNVILEGMSRGLAVIATDVGAVEAMVDSSNGWLIPALDLEALRLSILEAIRIPQELLAQKQKTSIRKVKEQFHLGGHRKEDRRSHSGLQASLSLRYGEDELHYGCLFLSIESYFRHSLNNNKVYFPGLNGLRFFAALAVILTHVDFKKLTGHNNWIN